MTNTATMTPVSIDDIDTEENTASASDEAQEEALAPLDSKEESGDELSSEGLIVVRQLPVIIQNLAKVKPEIERRANEAIELAKNCTPANYKSIKKLLTELNSLYGEFENRRKAVKNEISKPYTEFEAVYKDCVSGPFENARTIIKEKIDYATGQILDKKREEAERFFKEYSESAKIDFLSFDRVGLKINLSVSEKALKEQIKRFIDDVAFDIHAIEAQARPEELNEIMVEYKKSLDLDAAFGAVTRRRTALEQEKKRAEEREKSRELRDKALSEFKAAMAEDEARSAEKAKQQTENISKEVTSSPLPQPDGPQKARAYRASFHYDLEAESVQDLAAFKKEMFESAERHNVKITKHTD